MITERLHCLKARYTKPCFRCQGVIEVGSDIFPGGGEEGTLWSHYECAVRWCAEHGRPLVPPTCKHWRMRGYCSYGQRCFYSHPQECLQQLAQKAAAQAAGSGAACARRRSKGPSKRNKLKNDWRAAELRRFLIDTYGRDLLRSGTGVLDIAGGHGALSFELINLNGIASTVIEPRPLKTDRYQRRLKGGIYHQSLLFKDHNRDISFERAMQLGCQEPPHVKMFFTKQMISALGELQALGEGSPGYEELLQHCCDLFAQSVQKAAKMTWTQRGVVYEGHEGSCNAAAGAASDGDGGLSDDGSEEEDEEGGFGALGSAADITAACSWLGIQRPPPAVQHTEQEKQRQQQQEQKQEQEQGVQCSMQGVAPEQAAGGQQQQPCAAVQAAGASSRSVAGEQAAGQQLEAGTASGAAAAGAAALSTPAPTPAPPAVSASSEAATVDVADACAADAPAIDPGTMLPLVHTILNCSIIVGMHPDQATEYIVQLALRLGKPFAIVPCCVYQNQFEWRRLQNGGHVRSLEELIKYVEEKDPANIQVMQLPFEGMNRVVWRVVGSSGAASAAGQRTAGTSC